MEDIEELKSIIEVYIQCSKLEKKKALEKELTLFHRAIERFMEKTDFEDLQEIDPEVHGIDISVFSKDTDY